MNAEKISRGAMLTPPKQPYGGYLAPHEAQIRRLAGEGMSSMRIAELLFAQGVRSPNEKLNGLSDHAQILTFRSLIRHILGLTKKRLNKKKLIKRVKWAKEQLRNAERLLARAKQNVGGR